MTFNGSKRKKGFFVSKKVKFFAKIDTKKMAFRGFK